MPHLTILRADAGECDLAQRFDLIFSCMMLHWFAQPAEKLRRWRRWLAPQGILHVAVPVAGSLGAWRDLCDDAGVRHGVWPFPPPDFADSLVCGSVLQQHAMSYASVFEFLRALKRSGGSTPRRDYEPISSAEMRELVRTAPRLFRVSYNVLYARVGPA
jgi:malonyl-CoA O-methyltransferase